MTTLRFTLADLERAAAAWSCSCGPAALAAICGLTLDEVRPHFPGFKGWVNPTMMRRALESAGRRFHFELAERPSWPRYGLARIQFDGPWLKHGVNPRASYRYTHWVGAWIGSSKAGHEVQVFDVNTIGEGATAENGAGWLPLEWWIDSVVPALTADIKRATGGWHITHAIEVERR